MEKKAVVGLFYKDDKYLMVSRKSGKYGFLGGKIEENETSYDALTREIAEEAGIKVSAAKYFFSKFDGDYITDCFYVASYTSTEPLVSPEGLNLQWFCYEDVLKNSEFVQYNSECLAAFKRKIFPSLVLSKIFEQHPNLSYIQKEQIKKKMGGLFLKKNKSGNKSGSIARFISILSWLIRSGQFAMSLVSPSFADYKNHNFILPITPDRFKDIIYDLNPAISPFF